MTPCPHCPVDPPRDCRAARTGLARVCDLCDEAHPDFAPGFAGRLAAASGRPPAAPGVAPEVVPAPAPETGSDYLRMLRCPRRGPRAVCGCESKNRCDLYDLDVSPRECLDCVRGSPPMKTTPAPALVLGTGVEVL